MGHHALAHGSTSLLVGKKWLDEMEMEERESGWFESKRSQSIHRQHNNMQMRSVIRENLRSKMGLLRDVLQKYKIY